MILETSFLSISGYLSIPRRATRISISASRFPNRGREKKYDTSAERIFARYENITVGASRHGYISCTRRGGTRGQAGNRAASNIGRSERIKGDKTRNLGTDRFGKDPPKYDKTASEDFATIPRKFTISVALRATKMDDVKRFTTIIRGESVYTILDRPPASSLLSRYRAREDLNNLLSAAEHRQEILPS